MRYTLRVLGLLAMVMTTTLSAHAQYRSHLPNPYSLMGPTVMLNKPDMSAAGQFGLASLRMGHSYEMSFGGFGGQMYNQNMYTNTLTMQFNEKMTGRLDVAFAHSPFGSALPGINQSGRVFIRNAEFNYAINDKTNISVHFSQNPNPMGYYGGPFGNGYGYSPFNSRSRNGYSSFPY
jgi:hypothetical protein